MDMSNICSSQYYGLAYYIDERRCNVGDKVYVKREDRSTDPIEMEIVHITRRSDNIQLYDELGIDVLLLGEEEYDADTSAEFITDKDSYLVWFRYIK